MAASELVITTDPPRPPLMMCGTAALIVFHWPVRLISIISSQTCSSISSVGAGVGMPAFAAPFAHGGGQRRQAAHVHLGGDDPPVQRLDLLDRAGEILGGRHRVRDGGRLAADVDRDDVPPLPGQGQRVAASLSARRAGDEGDLAVKQSHDALPLSRYSVSRYSATRAGTGPAPPRDRRGRG